MNLNIILEKIKSMSDKWINNNNFQYSDINKYNVFVTNINKNLNCWNMSFELIINNINNLKKFILIVNQWNNEGFLFKYQLLDNSNNPNRWLIKFTFYLEEYDNINHVTELHYRISHDLSFLDIDIKYKFKSNFEIKWKMDMDVYWIDKEKLIINKPNYLNFQKWANTRYQYNEFALSNHITRNWKRCNPPSSNDEYIILDTETTGLSPKTDEVIEIGAIKIKNQVIIDEFSCIININQKLSPFIVTLTGISQKMIDSGLPGKIVANKFSNFIEGYSLIAHNSPFDRSMINALFDKHGLKMIKKDRITNSIAMFRNPLYYGERNYRLSVLAKRKLPFIVQQHRAIDDCKLLYRLLMNDNVSLNIKNNDYDKLSKEFENSK